MSNKLYNKIVIKFSGDSGDGIQLLGNQFSNYSVINNKNDIYTFVDFPPEIRAPAGSINGVSSFQLTISKKKLYTFDNYIDVLIAFNPASLKKNEKNINENSIIIIDKDTFNEKNLEKIKYNKDILQNLYKKYKIIEIPITKITYDATKIFLESVSKAKRCKNFFILGLLTWLFDRKINNIFKNIKNKFKNNINMYNANKSAFLAGFNYGDVLELSIPKIKVPSYKKYIKKKNLIKISGNKALCAGVLTIQKLFKLPLFSAMYPITPASEILHELSQYISKDINIIQMEDEIACINAIIGASYAGALSITFTSGPGLDLMQEGLGLAIMSNLPIILVNIQRSGPSTGIPTKSEQTDLSASLYGRHGESKIVIIAPKSPKNCFWSIIEAFCLAFFYKGPVIILSDANLANSSEAWKYPKLKNVYKRIINLLKKANIKIKNLINDWQIMKKNKIICTGGLERNIKTNDVSHNSKNHDLMNKKRNSYLSKVKNLYENLKIINNKNNLFLIITWGSVYGVVKTLLKNLKNKNISLLVLRYIFPLHKDLKLILKKYKYIIVIEENLSQLANLLKSHYKIKIMSINQISGEPFNYLILKTKLLKIIKKYESKL